ncbi:HD domain-containing protein [Bacteriovoracaceae bacterium]|nr:HD domain-containing protein [Bacteriovoracaceae bacterium]
MQSYEYTLRVIRLAGLFHDLGHGPLSHFFEHCFQPKKLKELNNEYKFSEKWFKSKGDSDQFNSSKLEHEHISAALIKKMIPENDLAQDICSMLFDDIVPSNTFKAHLKKIAQLTCKEKINDEFLYSLKQIFKSIISGEIDADRLDYLQRDSHFSGVKISSIDIDHIINSISLKHNKAHGFYIRISPSAVSSVEQILISRRQMFNQVYLHRTCFLFGKLIENIVHEKKISIWKNHSLDDFVKLTDEVFINAIMKKSGIEKEIDEDSSVQISALLFQSRMPLSRITERYVAEGNLEQHKEDLKKIPKYEDAEFYAITPKEFTKLSRNQEKKGKNSLIHISLHDSEATIPLNAFSEVFDSTLWRKNVIRLLVVKSPIATAREKDLLNNQIVKNSKIDQVVADGEERLKKLDGKGKQKKKSNQP